MSFGTPPFGPPILPPVPGTPNGPSDYPAPTEYPPWFGTATVDFPPAAMVPAAPTDFQAGPYCFNLDKYICAYLPEKIHVGGAKTSIMERIAPGFDIPVWEFCKALTNTLCAMLMLLLLLTILGIAFAGLIL